MAVTASAVQLGSQQYLPATVPGTNATGPCRWRFPFGLGFTAVRPAVQDIHRRPVRVPCGQKPGGGGAGRRPGAGVGSVGVRGRNGEKAGWEKLAQVWAAHLGLHGWDWGEGRACKALCRGLHPTPACPGLHPTPACPGLHFTPACPGLHFTPACPGLHFTPACLGLHPTPACPGLHPTPVCRVPQDKHFENLVWWAADARILARH
eukprot:357062-Chlamydomonas_euryale.AAC.1